MREVTLTLRNKTGLHARPAALFVQAAKGFQSTLHVRKDDREVDAKSILSVLTLGAESGAVITLTAEGNDEDLAVETLQKLIESNFGETDAAA
jgi:phosphocarrier protein HPr